MLLRTAALLLLLLAVPAAAHENHQQSQAGRVEQAELVGQSSAVRPTPGAAREAAQENMREMAERADAGRPLPVRMLNWLGRMHPFFVHFPIALFPICWIALVLARRRGEQVEIIRALIIVAGLSTLVAAVAGWLGAGFTLADRDAIQSWHRWIGTGLAAAGALAALWAWRRRGAASSQAMVMLLGTISLCLLAQGWLGGAITHGLRHMIF